MFHLVFSKDVFALLGCFGRLIHYSKLVFTPVINTRGDGSKLTITIVITYITITIAIHR